MTKIAVLSKIDIELIEGESMEFIKNMRKREFIETTLKFISALCASFIAIILMEGMIYGIFLNSLTAGKNNSLSTVTNCTIFVHQTGEDEYTMLSKMPEVEGLAAWSSWTGVSENTVNEKINQLMHNNSGPTVHYRLPNAFELVIDGMHIAVMSIFVLLVVGYFSYRYIKLDKSYKQVEREFKATGSIEIIAG